FAVSSYTVGKDGKASVRIRVETWQQWVLQQMKRGGFNNGGMGFWGGGGGGHKGNPAGQLTMGGAGRETGGKPHPTRDPDSGGAAGGGGGVTVAEEGQAGPAGEGRDEGDQAGERGSAVPDVRGGAAVVCFVKPRRGAGGTHYAFHPLPVAALR